MMADWIPSYTTDSILMGTIDLSHVEVVHRDGQQFEITVDGETAVAEYRLVRGIMIFTHTEVPPVFEGQGVAGKLVRTALEHARAAGLAVWPVCPFVRSYIRRHPEFQDLVAPRARD